MIWSLLIYTHVLFSKQLGESNILQNKMLTIIFDEKRLSVTQHLTLNKKVHEKRDIFKNLCSYYKNARNMTLTI